MIFKGFRFGMLLQFSIGPVCLLVFQTASRSGFLLASILTAAVALVDALFIVLAIFGTTSVLKHPKIQFAVKIAGSIILLLFGANTVLSVWGISLLPSVNLFSGINASNVFLQGLLLTASNPLTILFWGGVFTSKALDEQLNQKQLIAFGAGCVLSTVFFMTLIAGAGSLIGVFLPSFVLSALNLAVGAAIMVFGIKMLLKARA